LNVVIPVKKFRRYRHECITEILNLIGASQFNDDEQGISAEKRETTFLLLFDAIFRDGSFVFVDNDSRSYLRSGGGK